MTKPYSCDQLTPSSFQNSNPEDKNDLKQAIKDFLFAASVTPPRHRVCPRCGQPMEYTETLFWIYGEDDSFKVRQPMCRCAARIPN
jgi:hypothetical protein